MTRGAGLAVYKFAVVQLVAEGAGWPGSRCRPTLPRELRTACAAAIRGSAIETGSPATSRKTTPLRHANSKPRAAVKPAAATQLGSEPRQRDGGGLLGLSIETTLAVNLFIFNSINNFLNVTDGSLMRPRCRADIDAPVLGGRTGIGGDNVVSSLECENRDEYGCSRSAKDAIRAWPT